MQLMEEVRGANRTFAIVLRGYPEDFGKLVNEAKVLGLYVVFTKTSFQKLVVEEVPF